MADNVIMLLRYMIDWTNPREMLPMLVSLLQCVMLNVVQINENYINQIVRRGCPNTVYVSVIVYLSECLLFICTLRNKKLFLVCIKLKLNGIDTKNLFGSI